MAGARGGILPTFHGSDDVRAIQARLAAVMRGTDKSVQQCAGITDATRSSWGLFYSSVLDYTNEEPRFWGSNAQYGRGESFEDEVVAWQDKLQAAGCSMLVPKYNPKDEESKGGAEAVTWIGIAVAALAGAYVVGKVIPLIPRIRMPQLGGGRDRDDPEIQVRQKKKEEDPSVERERERRQRQRDDAERAAVRRQSRGGAGGAGHGGGIPQRTLPEWQRQGAEAGEVSRKVSVEWKPVRDYKGYEIQVNNRFGGQDWFAEVYRADGSWFGRVIGTGHRDALARAKGLVDVAPRAREAGEIGFGRHLNWKKGVRLEGVYGSNQFNVKRGGSTIGTILRRPNGSWLYRTPQDTSAWRGSAHSRDGAARKVVLSYSW
jgi:hypothetical protein